MRESSLGWLLPAGRQLGTAVAGRKGNSVVAEAAYVGLRGRDENEEQASAQGLIRKESFL